VQDQQNADLRVAYEITRATNRIRRQFYALFTNATRLRHRISKLATDAE